MGNVPMVIALAYHHRRDTLQRNHQKREVYQPYASIPLCNTNSGIGTHLTRPKVTMRADQFRGMYYPPHYQQPTIQPLVAL